MYQRWIPHGVFVFRALEGIHAQVRQQGRTKHLEGILPHPQALGLLLEERDFVVAVAQRRHAAVIGPVDELLARPLALRP